MTLQLTHLQSLLALVELAYTLYLTLSKVTDADLSH